MPLLILCLLVFSQIALAEDVVPYVPPALAPWVPWVLHDDPAPFCPTRYDQSTRMCAWVSPLRLDLDEQGGNFEQEWQVLYRSSLTLPGDAQNWPTEVMINGQAAIVLESDGRPTVSLEAGTYRMMGRFVWTHLPERLKLPPETALLQLSVSDQVVSAPHQEGDYLWLRSTTHGTNTALATDSLAIQVFRRLQDGQPFLVTTHLTLDVAGRDREVRLPSPLPPTALPIAIRSPLPNSLDASGEWRVQLRPGRWELEVDARFPTLLESLITPSQIAPWPEQEIWTFQADPNLRLVEPKGLTTLDPQQTHLPNAWRHLPTFLAQPGQSLTLMTLQRGDATPEPDRLQLDRTLWLDFNGVGLNIADRLTGTLSQDGRLTTPDLPLGQVNLAGNPQFVTRLPNQQEGNRPGIEVRRGPLMLETESRWTLPVEGSTSGVMTSSLLGVALTLPANGWDRDLQTDSTTLHLGPGWSLFAAFGMDKLPTTWVGEWTLLDLFLVLITLLAISRFYGVGLAVPAGVALVLSWQLPEAPQLGWINLLAAAALLQVLPEGRFAVWVRRYRLASVAVISMMLIGLMFHSVRAVLYPQLERGGGSVTLSSPSDAVSRASAPTPAPPPVPLPMMAKSSDEAAPAPMKPPGIMGGSMQEESSNIPNVAQRSDYKARAKHTQPLPTIDPDAKIQTGPGIPEWHWHTLGFSWSGPVSQGQTYTLWLFNPLATRLWRVAQCLGALFLAWLIFLDLRTPPLPLPPSSKEAATEPPIPSSLPTLGAVALVLMSVFVGAGMWSAPLRAESISTITSTVPSRGDAEGSSEGSQEVSRAVGFPSPELLETLRTRLTAPPHCLPACAQLDRLEVRTSDKELILALTLDAQTLTAIPLPIDPRRWQPTSLSQDGLALGPSSRWQEGALWQIVPAGQHVLVLRGPLVGEKLAVPLPLKPHRLIVTTPGWQVDGIGPDGLPGDQLLLYRQHEVLQPTTAVESPQPLPLFVKVERTLKLGLDWEVETHVKRLSPSEVGASLRLPILAGEAVQTPGCKVADGLIEVSLPAGRNDVRWVSRLTSGDHLTLTAPNQASWMEVWRLEASPLWHTELRGLAPMYTREGSQWYPVWQPFPGEQVEIAVTRPLGVPGDTLTFKGVRLQLTPGQRLAEATLTLHVRSSQGGQHILPLPLGAEVLRTQVDGRDQPLRLEQGGLILPLTPAERRYEVTWRVASGLALRYDSPLVDMGRPGVNVQIDLHLPADRWLLWITGPILGPAVLFWGMLAGILLIAWLLGRSGYTPIATHQWALLGVGLSQLDPLSALGVVALPFALARRARLDPNVLRLGQFRGIQIGLVVLMVVALSTLVTAVDQGLLGIPDMAVTGNGSVAGDLHWYADRFTGVLPVVTVLSIPLWCYRLVMLLWALWLALALVRWAPWVWRCWSSGGFWRNRPSCPVEGGR